MMHRKPSGQPVRLTQRPPLQLWDMHRLRAHQRLRKAAQDTYVRTQYLNPIFVRMRAEPLPILSEFGKIVHMHPTSIRSWHSHSLSIIQHVILSATSHHVPDCSEAALLQQVQAPSFIFMICWVTYVRIWNVTEPYSPFRLL